MANDNWDSLLQDLGTESGPAKRETPPPASVEPTPAPAEPEASTPPPAPVVSSESVELPEEYPTAKPSAWESLAANLGVADAPAPTAEPPKPKPAAEPRVAEKKPAPPKPASSKVDEGFGQVKAAAQADPPADEIKAKAAPAKVTPSPAEAPAPVEASEEAAPKAKGFTGWFPFAARRAKPEPAVESAPETTVGATEAVQEEAKLPEDLFVEPEASASADSPEAAEADGETTEKPKRRRRRGGRRRRKSADPDAAAAAEGAEATGLSAGETPEEETGAGPEPTVEEGGFGAGILGGAESKESDSGDGDEEGGERPKRRRRRRRRRGRGRSSEEGAGKATTGSVSEEAAEEEFTDDLTEAPSYGSTADSRATDYDTDEDDEPTAVSHKNITPWPDAIGVLVDANIAARDSRRPATVGSGRGGGRGGRSRGGGRRRRGGSGGSSNGSSGEASN